MLSYVVLFIAQTHVEDSYVPPAGVMGGIMGETPKGLMAVYDVPETDEEEFRRSVENRPDVAEFHKLGDKAEMKFPNIHRNGTHPKDLLESYNKAHAALWDALNVLRNHGAPNGRDYYFQSAGAFESAVAEHEDRIARVESVRAEIDALREHVSAAMTK